MRHNTLAEFSAELAAKGAVHIAVRRSRIPDERQRVEFGAGLQNLVAGHSSHGVIVSILGVPSNPYGQPENPLSKLVGAFKAALANAKAGTRQRPDFSNVESGSSTTARGNNP